MSASINSFEEKTTIAVSHFWRAREQAFTNQKERNSSDQGNRSEVTAGKNLDGFIEMTCELIIENGLSEFDIIRGKGAAPTIPGFYRPTKNWDLLVVKDRKLVAAIEFKSQVGPSFGNNFNNRVEEALGNAADINTAFREGAFGESTKPFVGYLFVLEDCEKSCTPVRIKSPHFSAFPEFEDTSYAQRYDIFCRKLVQERLYDAAALVLSDKQKGRNGVWSSMSELTSAKRFATTLAGKIASIAIE